MLRMPTATGICGTNSGSSQDPWLRLQSPHICSMVEADSQTSGGGMAGEIEARLKALNIALPEVASPLANYVPFIHVGDQLFISGQLPLRDGSVIVTGKLGAGLDLAQGEEAARLCALNILAQAKAALRDLDRIMQLLRLNGFVNAAPDFTDHPKVINGASNLMVDVLGNKGRHTRIAVGCASLPLGAAVEIDAVFAIA
jgi:enamine deaminase RidA (YjgF/YER057c/UK114 family)